MQKFRSKLKTYLKNSESNDFAQGGPQFKWGEGSFDKGQPHLPGPLYQGDLVWAGGLIGDLDILPSCCSCHGNSCSALVRLGLMASGRTWVWGLNGVVINRSNVVAECQCLDALTHPSFKIVRVWSISFLWVTTDYITNTASISSEFWINGSLLHYLKGQIQNILYTS